MLAGDRLGPKDKYPDRHPCHGIGPRRRAARAPHGRHVDVVGDISLGVKSCGSRARLAPACARFERDAEIGHGHCGAHSSNRPVIGSSVALDGRPEPRVAAAPSVGPKVTKHVWRAQIILATAEGCGTAEIMRRARVSKPCV
jgi:hypothetical protein